MHDVVKMAVLHCTDNLLEESLGFLWGRSAFADDVVEQLTPRGVLHDHEDVSWCVNDFVEADDVGVPAEFQNVDLAPHFLSHLQGTASTA